MNRPGSRAATETDAAGFVLAGGRSSRMGMDKALVRLAGQPLAARAVRILQDAGLVVSVAGGGSGLADFAQLIADRQPGLGPLGGICAALGSTSARWAVFLPVDLPLLPPSLVAYLLQHARITESAVTLPSVNGFAQTFPAILKRATLPMLERELESGKGGCFSAFEAAVAGLGETVTVVPVEMLLQAGQIAHPSGPPAVHWFLNLNTVENLRRAEALCEAMIA